MTTDVDPLDDDEPLSAVEIELRRKLNMFDLGDRCPMAEFQARLEENLNLLAETRRPKVLIGEGGREFVVQSAEGYRVLLQRLDYAESVVDIMHAREALARGDSVPLDEAFQQIRDGTWRDEDSHR
jgi:hypothetical protein